MPLCRYKEPASGGVTVVDNRFVTQYCKDAPEKSVAAYLYGLYLCQSGAQQELDGMARALGQSEEAVSYTHLDVYKRQVLERGTKKGTSGGSSFFCIKKTTR